MNAGARRLRVLGDGAVFENTYQRGIQRYCAETLSRVGQTCDVALRLSGPAAVPLPANCRVMAAAETVSPRRYDVARRFVRKYRHLAASRANRKCDLFHSLYFTLAPPSIPMVATVYDMILELLPEWYGDADHLVEAKRAAVRAAEKVITISVAAGDELAACYPECRGKVVPVYLGADHFPAIAAESVAVRADAPVVYVGDRPRYKNFRVLLDALVDQHWPAAVRLAVVGKPFSTAERIVMERLGVMGRIDHLGRLSDEAVGRLYAGATAMVCPSLAEGFGLPVVEAQRSGCPVACSDLAVFREVAGPAAVFFDPSDPGAVAIAVDRCRDPAFRRGLVEAGFVNASRFTWDRCAQETLAVYRAVAKRGDGPEQGVA